VERGSSAGRHLCVDLPRGASQIAF
jgi:hypothetical protein